MKILNFTLAFLLLACTAFASQNKKTVKLRIQAPTGNLDDATMYFDDGITPAYDIHQDAEKIFSDVPGIPVLFSVTSDNVACSINGCGTLEHTEVVSLGYYVGYKGVYTISGVAIDNFDATSIIQLEDRKLDTIIDLRQNFYQVMLDTGTAELGRFYLHVSTPITFASANSNCTNTEGSISLSPDSSIVWTTCQLFNDSNNTLLTTYNDVTAPVIFSGLGSGDYHVVLNFGPYSTTKNFHVSGNYVVANIDVPGPHIYTYQDVVFDAVTANANQYEWDFGDGTLIDGVAHPTQRYFVPGKYTVTLYCYNNAGCSAEAEAEVTVLQGTTAINDVNSNGTFVTAQGKSIVITLNNNSSNNTAEVYNLLGQNIAQ
ncbi:MAG TPA: PKD domain-containing protein, partial [Chitinophagales bacterium]|nr:PKD domain-containing protein [Chitinophagales bacterium]